MQSILVGILNLTPDSFSGDGMHYTPEGVYEKVREMHAQGVKIIDIGAESTRPGANPITSEEEGKRLELFNSDIMQFCQSNNMQVSVDTRHAATAAMMLTRGANWINDVAGMTDAAMRACVRESRCRIVLMHSLSVPADKANTIPENADATNEVLKFFQSRIALLESEGIARSRLILDPGIGFGKTAVQSLELLRRVDELRTLGLPLLIGHSRKSFLKIFADRVDADDATLAVSSYLIHKKVEYLRVHNIERHAQLLKVSGALIP